MFASIPEFKSEFLSRIEKNFEKSLAETTKFEQFLTLGHMIMDYIDLNWKKTNQQSQKFSQKQVYYLSIEFLLGRQLRNNLMNLGIENLVNRGLKELGIDLEELEDQEADAGLGNGGLGRLAACFLDSLSTLNFSGHGCGIRYKHGLFEQKIVNGYQVEIPELWLQSGHVWLVRKEDEFVDIPFWGNVECYEENGRLSFHHSNAEIIKAVPYDLPIIGYQTDTENTLRLWNAEPYGATNAGAAESISELLYPGDTTDEGKILRLKQQYFLVAASLKWIVRTFKMQNPSMLDFHKHVSIHINDTHPALAVPELMRILVDEECLDWDEAWHITVNTLSYTNHTILAEALEQWPIRIFQPLLPRIFMIVKEINERFCKQLWEKYPGNWDKISSMAIIANQEVKMAPLAIVGSHSVNGVAKLHTKILKEQEMRDYYQEFPERFNNKTNGITHRRWLLKANPLLSDLISESIGTEWIEDPAKLEGLLQFKQDSAFLKKLDDIKSANKVRLANIIYEKCGIKVDSASIFDVQVKRLHAYKRQLLNVLHIMHLYNCLKEDPNCPVFPRTFIFGAKAAPTYYFAKNVIKLITTLAGKINQDRDVNDKLKVVFIENYRVSMAENIIPAADLSEQISTASKEASGTGNMKFMMNGALTIGTLDGANVEITDLVGRENIFLFGISAGEVIDYQYNGGYSSRQYYDHDLRIRKVIEQLQNGFFPFTYGEFSPIYDALLYENDQYFILRDFASYLKVHEKINEEYLNRKAWLEKSLINIAKSGYFSSDRTIREYAEDIWNISPHTVTIGNSQ